MGAPDLFIHERTRQSLARKLSFARNKRPVVLAITDNRHDLITHEVKQGVLYARVHHLFLDAPKDVLDELVQFICADVPVTPKVDDFSNRHIARFARRTAKRVPQRTLGSHHNLAKLFDKVRAEYFDGRAADAVITWGRRVKRHTPRKTVRLGACKNGVITINPVLDKPWVPRYFIEAVIHHELLHHVLPERIENGRRCLHHGEFLEREREFRAYARAVAWEKKNLSRLLRAT